MMPIDDLISENNLDPETLGDIKLQAIAEAIDGSVKQNAIDFETALQEVTQHLAALSLSDNDAVKDQKQIALTQENFPSFVKLNVLQNQLTTNTNSAFNAFYPTINFLRRERATADYQKLKNQIINKETVPPFDYLYFVLTTDDLTLVDLNILDGLPTSHLHQAVRLNVEIIKLALRYHHEKDPRQKKIINEQLKLACQKRDEDGSQKLAFLNLPNLNLADIDLSSTSLLFSNLERTSLRNALLENTCLSATNLSNANLEDACTNRERHWHSQSKPGVAMRYSLAHFTNFNHVYLANNDMSFTDCANATLRDAEIIYTNFSNVNLLESDCENANLNESHLSKSKGPRLDGANLIGANTNFDLSKCSVRRLKVLPKEVFHSVANLNATLTAELKKIIENNDEDGDLWRQILANNIVRSILALEMDDDDKLLLFDAALAHEIFETNNSADQYINSITKNIHKWGSYFFTEKSSHHITLPTLPQYILEAGRDQVVPQKSRMLLC